MNKKTKGWWVGVIYNYNQHHKILYTLSLCDAKGQSHTTAYYITSHGQVRYFLFILILYKVKKYIELTGKIKETLANMAIFNVCMFVYMCQSRDSFVVIVAVVVHLKGMYAFIRCVLYR